MAACAKPTADSSSSSFNLKSSSMNKIPRTPATKPIPTQQKTGGLPRNNSNANSINFNGAGDRATPLVQQQSSISNPSPSISAPSAANLNALPPTQIAPSFVPNAAAVGPRLRYPTTNGHGDNVGYTSPPMYMSIPISHCPPAFVEHPPLAALEWENITVRDLLLSPPPQPSALRVHLPQPQPHPLSNIHPNPLQSMSVPSQSQLPPSFPASASSRRAYLPLQVQEQRPPPQREVCLKWLQGRCYRHPASCPYLHDQNAPRPPIYVCIKWLKGECDKQSSDCSYLHDKNAPRSTCMYWLRGHCPSSVCYFAHERPSHTRPTHTESRKDALPPSIPPSVTLSHTEIKKDLSPPSKPTPPPSDPESKKDPPSKPKAPPSDTESKRDSPSKMNPSSSSIESKKDSSKPTPPASNTTCKRDLPFKSNSSPSEESKKDTPTKPNPPSRSNEVAPVGVNGERETIVKPTEPSLHSESKSAGGQQVVVKPPEVHERPSRVRPTHTGNRKDTLPPSIPHPVTPSHTVIKKDSSSLSKPNPPPSDTKSKKDPPSKPKAPPSDTESKRDSPSKTNPSSLSTESKKDSFAKPIPSPSNTENKKDTSIKPNPPSRSNEVALAGVNGNRESIVKPTEPSLHSESKSAGGQEVVVKPAEPQRRSSTNKASVCRNWLRGECNKDSSTCLYLHDRNAPRLRCHFWRRESCPHSICEFAHEGESRVPIHIESRNDALPRSILISASPSTEIKKDPSPLPKPNSLASSDTESKADFPSKQALPSSNAGSKNGLPSKQSPSSNTESKDSPSNTEGKKDPSSKPNSLPSNTESKRGPSKSDPPADTRSERDPPPKMKSPSPSATDGAVFVGVNGNRESAMNLPPHPESKSAGAQPQHSGAYKRDVCINWLKGECDQDLSTCRYLHDLNAPRPPCNYWRSCYRRVCYYAHEGIPPCIPSWYTESKKDVSIDDNGKCRTGQKPTEPSPEPKSARKSEAVAKPAEPQRPPVTKSVGGSEAVSRGPSNAENRKVASPPTQPNPASPTDVKGPASVGGNGKREIAVKPTEPSRHSESKSVGKNDAVMKPPEPLRPSKPAGKRDTVAKPVKLPQHPESKSAGKCEIAMKPTGKGQAMVKATELSGRPEPGKRDTVVKPPEPQPPPQYKNRDTVVKPAAPLRPYESLFTTIIADHIKVKFDRGFDVQEVTTGFESRWVHLGNVKADIPKDAISQLLEKYGQVDRLNVPEAPMRKSMTVKAQFSSPSEAIRAATALNGYDFHGQPLTARVSISNSSRGTTTIDDTEVHVSWQLPHRMGYAGYATLKEAKAAMEVACATPVHDNIVTADLYDGLPAVGAYNVVLRYLPAQTTEKDIRRFGDAESIMLERPNYTSLERATQKIQSMLEECGTIIKFDVLPPPYSHGVAKAWVKFSTYAEARAAQDYLDNKDLPFLGRTLLYVRHVLSMSHTFPYPVYDKLREDIAWLRTSWSQRYGSGITLSARGNVKGLAEGPVFIRLSCEDATLLSHLKYEFEQLMRGETVIFDKKPIWDDFLISSAGTFFLEWLHQQYPGLEIQLHRQRRVVTVLGSLARRHQAKQEIIRKLVDVKSLQQWHIPFAGKSLGLFLSEDLLKLQDNLGAGNCFFDFAKRSLVVRGNEETFHIACKAVQDAQERRGTESSSDVVCPVCLDEAAVPTSLPCGHQWCRSCLMGYLAAAVDNKTFPLTCLGDDARCTEPIPLSLSRELLNASEFAAVLEAAFWTYVHGRPDEFHNCPAPDCTQIYRPAPRNTILQCPSCLARICPACHIEYHDGLTCEERDVADDKLFAEWRSTHDVKSCPVCRIPIERSEGCNHMTCTRCQSHICWQCLAIFPKGEGIYDHMRLAHGTIGGLFG